MSLELVLFIILGTIGIASAVGVITSKNPIAAAMFLVVHFMMLSGLYLTLNAQFMAVIQVLVYAGAIMVLVVFVIMLLNLGKEEAPAQRQTLIRGVGVGSVILLALVLVSALVENPFGHGPGAATAVANGTVEAVGTALFTTYVFPFEMVSFVLLAAAVGAVVLTKRHLE